MIPVYLDGKFIGYDFDYVVRKVGEKRMTVDLSKARAGQIAHFRCGGKANITEIKPMSLESGAVTISFDGHGYKTYHKDGIGWADCDIGLANIIRIEQPVFDWSTVKAGMCFEEPSGIHNRMWYVGKDPTHPTARLFSEGQFRYNDFSETLKDLVRWPEYDILVKP
jgi:hypothetical protein